ncbi:MAG: PD-(D/E)XK nuclease family protein [Woeseiaceae bacterium]|nr:PD-(D/E)XK nuclease family protein [Woeseiaceae bacterium]
MYAWLDDALSASDSYVITANRRLARDLRQAWGERQVAAGRTVWPTPAIRYINDWFSELADALPPADRLPARINSQHSRVLWEEILREDIEDPLAGIASLARQCRDTFARICEWNLSLADCQGAAVGRDQRVFARAAGKYVDRLTANGWIDEAQLPSALVERLASGAISAPARMVFAGFDRTTPRIEALSDALQTHGCELQTRVPAASGQAELHAHDSPDAELRAAGRWARERLEAAPERRVAIVVNQLERDAVRSARLLREGFTPGWQHADEDIEGLLNVSYGRRLSEFPAVRIALLALQWMFGELTGKQVSLLLRSPFVGRASTFGRSRLEMRMRRWPDRAWSRTALLNALSEFEETADAEDWIERFASLDAAIDGPDRRSPTQWAQAIDAALRELGWPGERSLSSAEFQLVNRWRNLLGEFARIETVKPSMSGASAMARLSTMASETLFQPESPSSAVNVLGPLEAAGLEFDDLWVTGMTADEWPPGGSPLALLNRDLQRRHRMPDATPEDTAEFGQRVLERLRASAGTCVFSFARTDGDAGRLPTALLSDLEISDDESDPGWHAETLLGDRPAEIADRVPRVAADEVVAGGASTIGNQQRDPFSAFCSGRLSVRTLDPFTAGIDAGMRGSLIHDALERLYGHEPKRSEIAAWTSEELEQRIERAVLGAFARHERHADAMLKALFRLERSRAAGLLAKVVALDAERDFERVLDVERRVEASLETIRLSLRCDRIDRLANGRLVILDYKSGTPQNFLTNNEPRDPQLVVYAAASEGEIDGLGLYHVSTRGVGINGAGPALADTDDWTEALTSWVDDVRRAAREIAAGDVRIAVKQTSRDIRPFNLLSRYTELRRES